MAEPRARRCTSRLALRRGSASAVRRVPCPLGRALAVAAIIVIPVAYAAFGGFRDRRSWRPIRSVSRTRGSGRTTSTRSRTRRSGCSSGTAPSSPRCRRSSSSSSRRSQRSCSHAASSRPRGRLTLFTLGCCSRSRSRSCRCSSSSATSACRTTRSDWRSRGGLRPLADDHHPAPVLQPIRRSSGCRSHRRLRLARLLLPDPAAVVTAGARYGGRPPSCSAGISSCCRSCCCRASRTGPAPRRYELLDAVHHGHREDLAYTTLALVPALVFYIIAERQIVRGLTTGR